MNQLYVPSKIRLWIDKKPYIVDNVGMSGNQVLIFEDMVLKIEENSIVVRRQLEVMKWLEGRVLAPRVLEYEEENGKSYLLHAPYRIHTEGNLQTLQNLHSAISKAPDIHPEPLHRIRL